MESHINKIELLNRIREARDNFQELLSHLTDSQMVTAGVIGSWSVKDIIAHVIAHEQLALRELDGAKRGILMTSDQLSTDSINADAVEASKSLSLDEIRESWQRSYEQILRAIEALTNEDFEPSGELTQRLEDTIDGAFGNNTYGHYAEHEGHIRAWLSKISQSN
jgi:hypothetical protein